MQGGYEVNANYKLLTQKEEGLARALNNTRATVETVRAVADVLEADNPRFHRAKFEMMAMPVRRVETITDSSPKGSQQKKPTPKSLVLVTPKPKETKEQFTARVTAAFRDKGLLPEK